MEDEINEDLNLIKQFLEGEKGAFTTLVHKYEKKAYYLAYRFTHNHHDADDISQEAFIKVYSSLKNFKGDSSFFTWLYRIIVNLCINYLNRRPKQMQEPVENFQLSNSDPPIESAIENKELQMKIKQAIEQLPPQQKVAFSLRQLEGLPFKETSEIMDCSVGAAKASYFQAVQKLRKYLKKK